MDTNTMLRGLFGHGQSRRLLALLAYGTLTQRADQLRLEHEQLQQLVEEHGGEIGGMDYEALVERAMDAKARVGELLPVGAPDDWSLAVSKPIIDEYQRKMTEIGHKLAGKRGREPLTDEELRGAGAVIMAITSDVIDVPADVPEYVSQDRDDDHFVHAALHGNADVIVTDDRHLVPKDQDSEEYNDEQLERHVMAMNLGPFAERCLDRGTFELNDVGPSVLNAAVAELTRT